MAKRIEGNLDQDRPIPGDRKPPPHYEEDHRIPHRPDFNSGGCSQAIEDGVERVSISYEKVKSA